MRIRKPSAGDIIEAKCTRCRALLNHTIVAMVGDRVARVECNTCHGVHNYREGTEQRESVSRSPSRKTTEAPLRKARVPVAAEQEEWGALSPSLDMEKAFSYDMNGKYKVNDLISHSVFGLGVVRAVIGPNKMEVLFQQGKKLLRCA
jgi:hypothetical protein